MAILGHEVWFGIHAAVVTAIIPVGTILNSFVIHFTNHKSLTGFPHLNTVVRQLAVSDLLYGILAYPLMLIGWKMRKIFR